MHMCHLHAVIQRSKKQPVFLGSILIHYRNKITIPTIMLVYKHLNFALSSHKATKYGGFM